MGTITGQDSLVRNDIPFEKGLSKEEVCNRYNNWGDYDKYMMPNESYNGPIFAADAVKKHVTDKSARILDIGAGTGHIGVFLHEDGYQHLDALEPSKLVAQARERNAYSNFYEIFFGVDAASRTTIPNESYDCVVSSGCYGESHLPINSIDETLRILRPGGTCVIVMRENWVEGVEAYKGKLEPYMKQLEKDGKWKCLERSTRPHYFVDKDGAIFVYRKC